MRRRRPPSSPIDRELVSDQDNSDHGVAQIQNSVSGVSQIQNTVPEMSQIQNTFHEMSQILNTVPPESQGQNTVSGMSPIQNEVSGVSQIQTTVLGLTLTEPMTQEKEPRSSDFTNPGFMRYTSPLKQGCGERDEETVGDVVSDYKEKDKHKEEGGKDITYPDEIKQHFKVTAISFDVAVEHLV